MKKFTVHWTTSKESCSEDIDNIIGAVEFARAKIGEDIFREPRIVHIKHWERLDGTPAEEKLEEYFLAGRKQLFAKMANKYVDIKEIANGE